MLVLVKSMTYDTVEDCDMPPCDSTMCDRAALGVAIRGMVNVQCHAQEYFQ
jgi:hypothetical protein